MIYTVLESQEGKTCLNLVKKGSWKPRVLLWNCETPAPTILPRWIMGPSGPRIHQLFITRDGSHRDNFGESIETFSAVESSHSRGFLSTVGYSF